MNCRDKLTHHRGKVSHVIDRKVYVYSGNMWKDTEPNIYQTLCAIL